MCYAVHNLVCTTLCDIWMKKLRSLQIVLILITLLIGIDITTPNLLNKAINESSMGLVIQIFLVSMLALSRTLFDGK